MKVSFNIQCEMEERWVNDFCSMLKTMEDFGYAGHSGIVAIYSDGDGDFRPKFDIELDYEKVSSLNDYKITKEIDCLYDAG